jgi:hypothetical protein
MMKLLRSAISRRSMTSAALWQTLVLPACVGAWLTTAGFSSSGSDVSGAAPVLDRVAPELAANAAVTETPRQAILNDNPAPITADYTDLAAIESVTVPTTETAPASRDTTEAAPASRDTTKTAPASRDEEPIVTAALTNSAETLPAETLPPDTSRADTNSAVSSVAVLDECFVADACIDRYLWALYQRTPKEDSIKETEKRKVTIKRKGRLVTVTRSFTKLVDEDFAWKDPKAAEKAGMSMMDYVIGGMDRSFKLKLFQTLRAAETAGLSPGITSAFRDDYRQSIASGLKAADNRSYHGGSLRGGYGHGMAADIVSVNGANRAQRWTSTEILWKWIDAHGKDFGIARPYLDRDPPHVAPVDGKEYADHAPRGTKAQQARAQQSKTQQRRASARKSNRFAAHADHGTARRQSSIRSSKVRAT